MEINGDGIKKAMRSKMGMGIKMGMGNKKGIGIKIRMELKRELDGEVRLRQDEKQHCPDIEKNVWQNVPKREIFQQLGVPLMRLFASYSTCPGN